MSDFRLLLLDISNEITNADLAKLKFLCEDVIPRRTADEISHPFELFRALEERNLLSEQNREFLASKLSDVKRVALRNKLLGIQDDTPALPMLGQEQIQPVRQVIPRYFQNTPVPPALCHDLAEDVSTSWKMLSRHLVIPEAVMKSIDFENHRVVEKCIAMFDEWKSRHGDNATVRVLMEALEKIGRRDLSEKVRDEMEALRQRNLQLAERELAPGNNDREGVPGEERQPFPRLHEMESALSNIRRWEPPLPTIRSGLGGAQEHVEPSTTPDSTSSPTRVPREPLSHEASIEGGSHETDFTDQGPGVAEPLQTGTQVTFLRSQLGLDRDGAFLDPEKYDPIKHLGSGGFAEKLPVGGRSSDPGKVSPAQKSSVTTCFSKIFNECPLHIYCTGLWVDPNTKEKHIIVGAEEGVYSLNFSEQLHEAELEQICGRRCTWLSIFQSVMVSLQGSPSCVYTQNLDALHDKQAFFQTVARNNKISETRGCSKCCIVNNPYNSQTYLCVALTRSVLLYQWYEPWHRFMRVQYYDVDIPSPPPLFEPLVLSDLEYPLICVGVKQKPDGDLHFDCVNVNSLSNWFVDSPEGERIEADTVDHLEKDTVLVAFDKTIRFVNLEGKLKQFRRQLSEIHFDIKPESVVCLQGSVLAFHEHGLQGRSLHSGRVNVEMNDPKRTFRLLGCESIAVVESKPADMPNGPCNLYILASNARK